MSQVTAWRITQSRHAAIAFTGQGARLFGGRWNTAGTPMVYTAESRALAALEMLVHLRSERVLSQYVLIPVTFDADLIHEVPPRRYPKRWSRSPPPRACQVFGDRWAVTRTSAVLRAPSALVKQEWNYLINPAHADFSRLRIGKPQPFQIDPRLISRS